MPWKRGDWRNTEQVFWSRMQRGGESECWEWTADRDRHGYGRIRWRGKMELAHRVAFFLTHDIWPSVVMHHCDNPLCCNPSHLNGGTHADNMADMVTKHRQSAPRGIANASAKITEELALEIYQSIGGHTEIAKRLGVPYTTVRNIRNGHTWRWATGHGQ